MNTSKKLVFLLFVSLIFPFISSAQQPLIPLEKMPNAVNFLPAPPDTASAAFQYDKAQYYWGLEQRKNPERRDIATTDAIWGLDAICKILSKPFGMTISKKTTPAIYRMLGVGIVTADQAGKLPKERYMRTRPYVFFKEKTLVPKDEEELSENGSYPSGHTILGWSAALLLTEVNPDSADAIMARAYMHGQSRVIAGFHWQSDVDAGRLVASVAIARLHADPEFRKMMEAAILEFEKLKSGKGLLKPRKPSNDIEPLKTLKPNKLIKR